MERFDWIESQQRRFGNTFPKLSNARFAGGGAVLVNITYGTGTLPEKEILL